MPITPDTKDWTWVLERPCPECGADVTSVDPAEIGGLIRSNADEWPQLLAHPKVGERPSDDRWSGLEYACHVRDVYRLYDERLVMMLNEDGARFPNWDQDEAAVAGRYGEEDPESVGAELTEAAERLAERFDSLSAADWERHGHRSDGADFTVLTFARYMIHDPIHHVHDVSENYRLLGDGR